MTTPRLRIGTRGSPLALAQADETRRRLIAAHPALAEAGAIDIVVIKTTGDAVVDRPLADVGGKGLFTKEIDEALLAGIVDLGVHSTKDMPTILPDGLILATVLPRQDPRDVLIAPGARSLRDLPANASLGTSSPRRQAQVLALRPDLRVLPLRGNVQTRLRKVGEGAVGATLLAMAGLRRLGLPDATGAILEASEMLPAVAQGAIGLECRESDSRVRALIQPLNDGPSFIAITAERAMLAALDGSCRTPIGGLAEVDGSRIVLRGLLARPDGSGLWRAERSGTTADAAAIGRDLGAALRAAAGADYAALTG